MTALRLDKLSLTNFRCFAHCEVAFHPNLAVLVAENGSGKTAVLDAAGHRAAVRARVRLILDMDVPPLVAIAQRHPDDAYRRALGAFVAELATRADAEDIALDDATESLRSAAALW